MIHAWLDLPLNLIFLTLVLLYGLSAAFIYWILFRSPVRRRVQTFAGVVAPYFGAIGVLFALLTGFLGAEVTDRNRQAARSVRAESSAIEALASLSHAVGTDGAAIRASVRRYLDAVLKQEWEVMSSSASAPAAAEALGAIYTTVAKPAVASAGGTPVQNSLLGATVSVATARADRLSLAVDRSYELEWASVLLLGILTQIALGFVHLEKPRAMLAAVGLFSVAAIVALGLIAAQENPFDPPIEVSNAPLIRALANVPAEP
jgi:hypothetical protein